MNPLDLLKSKTIWGTVLLILSYLAEPGVLDGLQLPSIVHKVLVVIGGLLTAIGVRTAIAKSGPTGGV